MKSVMNKGNVPVKIWSDINEVESSALDQLYNMSNLPFVYKHIAVMPDVHLGMGATVGSVIATEDAIVPAAIGVDIGCGMNAIKTSLKKDEVEVNIKQIRQEIEEAIPVGHRGNNGLSRDVESWSGWEGFDNLKGPAHSIFGRVQAQLGTLGGGNHFIEVCEDEESNVWLMLHSGSRNIGKTLADYHIKTAKSLMETFKIHLVDRDLAYLPKETEEFAHYFHDLMWCQGYAKQNRVVMMRRVLAVMQKYFKFTTSDNIDCHHNYCDIENHFGKNVYVTRKGAVRAREGDFGIIPGSMGTGSYIVKGKGNPQSFHSCSHGAGRRMSRTVAKKTFTVDDLIEQTAGVECRKDQGVVDEIPGAYKDINKVMENQSDLVEIVAKLKQFMCVKG